MAANTAIELFAGVGGFRLGFDQAGIETICQVEIDSLRRSVLIRRWPETMQFADVRTFGPNIFARVPDILYGGFPCTDISSATDTDIHYGMGGQKGQRTKQGGLAGSQSSLWGHFFRCVVAYRPKWVVVENVDGLRKGRQGADLRTLVGQLAGADYLGFGAVLDAAAFGLPARRTRVFIVARDGRSKGGVREWQRLADCFLSHEPGFLIPQRAGQSWATDDGAKRPTSGTYTLITPDEWEQALGWPQGHTAYTHDGESISNAQRYKMIGDGVAAPCAELIGKVIREVSRSSG